MNITPADLLDFGRATLRDMHFPVREEKHSATSIDFHCQVKMSNLRIRDYVIGFSTHEGKLYIQFDGFCRGEPAIEWRAHSDHGLSAAQRYIIQNWYKHLHGQINIGGRRELRHRLGD